MFNNTSKSYTFTLEGGLNTTVDELSLSSGALTDCQNYELDPDGGYRVIDGYERFDGRTKPSDAAYTYIAFSSGEVAVDDELTGATSGATGTCLAIGDGYAVVFTLSGTFIDGEDIEVDSTVVSTVDYVLNGSGSESYSQDKEWVKLAKEYARTLIETVPGEGQIRGVWSYKGTVYAFRNNVGSTECLMYKSTSTGWSLVTTASLDPDGEYEFVNYNFSGNADGLKMYGVDGVNDAFQFDGTTFTQISISGLLAKPSHITAHYNHLFLAAEGSILHSSIGDPTTFSAYSGAAELGMGDTVNTLLPTPGGTMIIATRSNIKALFGTSSSDWVLKNVSNEFGGIAKSIQGTLAPTFVSDRGLTVLSTTDKFGDFNDDVISYPVQKDITALINNITSSVVITGKQQYRVFTDGGDAIVATFNGSELRGFSRMSYPLPVRCVSAAKRNDNFGDNVAARPDDVFFGSDDGYVYQMDKGTSFDGEQITAIAKLPYSHLGYPRRKKRWRKAILDVSVNGGGESQLYIKPSLSQFRPNFPNFLTREINTDLTGGYYNLDNWDEFFWSTDDADNFYEMLLSGTAPGISLTFMSLSSDSPSHTIKSITYRYSPRGELR